MSHSTDVWKQASQEYEKISSLPLQQALTHVHNIKNIDIDVKQALITLVNSSSKASLFFEENVANKINLNPNNIIKVGQLIDEYELLEEIGNGGMSQVFKAKRISTAQQKQVAIKIFSPINNSKQLLEYFLNEQKILSQLSHPNIVDFLHGGTTVNDRPYLVMALVEHALPLDQYCINKCLPIKDKIKHIITCAHALSYLHANLVIHRDLKPDNILLNQLGEIKIVDFGIAKNITKPNHSKQSTLIALTPEYAAPEQINGGLVTINTDIFSLAIIALDLLTKEKPLPKDRLIKSCANDEEYIDKLLNSLNIDKDLKNILLTALQQQANKRYATMNSFAEDLMAWIENRPVSVVGNSLFYKIKKFAKRRVATFASLTTLMLTLISMLFILSWQNQQTIKEKQRAIEIKDFMLGILASTDPENQSEGQLKAIDVLHIASKQAQIQYTNEPNLESEILANIGTSFINLGAINDGKNLLLKSISLNPNNIKAKLNLARYYIDATKLEKSKTIISGLEKLNLENNSSEKLNLNLIKVFHLDYEGKISEAIKRVKTIQSKFSKIKDFKGMIESTTFLSRALFKTDKAQQAIDEILHLNSFLKDNNINGTLAHIKLNNQLSMLYLSKGQLPLSLQVIDDVLANIINNLGDRHPVYITALVDKATILNRLKKFAESRITLNQAYNTATETYGESSKLAQHTLYGLATLYEEEGNLEAAITKMNQVVTLATASYGINNPVTINISITLARLLFDNQQTQEAFDLILQIKQRAISEYGEKSRYSIFATNYYVEFMIQDGKAKEVLEIINTNYQNALINLDKKHPQTSYAKFLLNKIQTKISNIKDPAKPLISGN